MKLSILKYLKSLSCRDDDPAIVAGQGTMALEILEQMKNDVDAILIPVGGGGLLAGVAVAIKTLNPKTKIIVSLILLWYTVFGCIQQIHLVRMYIHLYTPVAVYIDA